MQTLANRRWDSSRTSTKDWWMRLRPSSVSKSSPFHTTEPLINCSDNQWQVDFNLSLKSFEPHIAGCLNLINLSAVAPSSPPIFFTSSIGTLGNWSSKHPGHLVPEEALTDPNIPIAQGYSESKWITE